MSKIRIEIEKVVSNAEKLNSTLNAFLSIDRAYALSQAEELANASFQGKLYGVPIAIKDNICTS